MSELTLRKIPFTPESENRLRMMKARTGLDRNYLCRIGFCLSLEEPGIPTLDESSLHGGREIDRYTLLGQHGQGYVSLLVVWMRQNGVAPSPSGEVDAPFVAHMNRGVELITSRVRTLVDLASLLPTQAAVSGRRAKGVTPPSA
jgi:DNA sulfur modification protein DndE